VLATLTASTLATPISIYDHYAPVKVAVAHSPVPIAHHEAIEVEHYVSATVQHDTPITYNYTLNGRAQH
jgi:hypothetical protein